MKLSELKAIVDKESARLARLGFDPLVVTLDSRTAVRRAEESGDGEELRHMEQAGIAELRSIESQCSNLQFYVREGMYANHPVFFLSADTDLDLL